MVNSQQSDLQNCSSQRQPGRVAQLSLWAFGITKARKSGNFSSLPSGAKKLWAADRVSTKRPFLGSTSHIFRQTHTVLNPLLSLSNNASVLVLSISHVHVKITYVLKEKENNIRALLLLLLKAVVSIFFMWIGWSASLFLMGICTLLCQVKPRP